MAEINCSASSACSVLREIAPEFLQDGVTEEIAASLRDNTGFNPNLAVLRTNYEDLSLANDCLVRGLSQELLQYEVCDWKDFTALMLGRIYDVKKAHIESSCGMWSHIHEMESDIEKLIAWFSE